MSQPGLDLASAMRERSLSSVSSTSSCHDSLCHSCLSFGRTCTGLYHSGTTELNTVFVYAFRWRHCLMLSGHFPIVSFTWSVQQTKIKSPISTSWNCTCSLVTMCTNHCNVIPTFMQGFVHRVQMVHHTSGGGYACIAVTRVSNTASCS